MSKPSAPKALRRKAGTDVLQRYPEFFNNCTHATTVYGRGSRHGYAMTKGEVVRNCVNIFGIELDKKDSELRIHPVNQRGGSERRESNDGNDFTPQSFEMMRFVSFQGFW